jgi:hypothetical protein
VVEEPDILPGAGGFRWSPRFGTAQRTAIVQFSMRALARSRQHRVILAFYLGMGFAFLILFSRAKPSDGQSYPAPPSANFLPIISDIMILCFWVIGTRVIFTMPLDLRANWIFRVTPVRGGRETLSAARLSLYLLAWVPVWAGSAIWFFSTWPWRMAAAHLAAFALIAAFVVEACMYRFQKIPFTCSWLPGKSNIFFAFGGFSFLLLLLLVKGAALELNALSDPAQYTLMMGILLCAAAVARWFTARRSSADEPVVQFEEEDPPFLQGLGLFRDGVLPSSAAGPDV